MKKLFFLLLFCITAGVLFAQYGGSTEFKQNKKIPTESFSLPRFDPAFDTLTVTLTTVNPGYLFPGEKYFVAKYEGNVWITTEQGKIGKSHNLGEWQLLNQGILNEGINYLEFVDTNVIYAAGCLGRIYKTTNGGLNWNICYDNLNATTFINEISFLTPQVGIAHGDQSFYAPDPGILLL